MLSQQSQNVWCIVPAKRTFGPAEVPASHYFMMGDNRDNSFDSRYFGPVARDRIVGKATAVVISLNHHHYWLPREHRLFKVVDGQVPSETTSRSR